MSLYDAFREYYFTDEPSAAQTVLKSFLVPLVPVYATARSLHQGYRSLTGVSVDVPVVSVGNVSLGGTGKTAFILRLLELLKERGIRPAVLKRGEAGGEGIVSGGRNIKEVADEYGDEVALYREAYPDVPVGVGSDRVQRAREFGERSDVDVLLLDDGFQYRCLHRDLDLVLLVASDVLNGWQLPAGPLREPLSSLRRADLVSLKKEGDSPDEGVINSLDKHLGPDSVRLTHEYDFRGIYRDDEDCTGEYRSEGGVLLSTLARPDQLEAFLESVGVPVRRHRALPDHSTFDLGELEVDSERLMMTPKAAVKLPEEVRRRVGIIRSEMKVEPLVKLTETIEDLLEVPR